MKTPASLSNSHSTHVFAAILLLATLAGPAALVSAVADSYTWSTVTGPAGSELSFYVPTGVAVDPTGNLYVAEWYSSTIFRIAPDGTSTTLAAGGWPDFMEPTGLAVDASGNVYVIEIYRVLKITADGAITILATLWDDPGRTYDYPQGVAVDDAGNVYVTDSTARSIRQIAPDGTVTTVAGTQGRFVYPSGVAVDAAHNVYVADANAVAIYRVTPAGVVTIVAGKPNEPGSADGPGSEARFGSPISLALDRAGNLYVSDTGWEHATPSSNNTIRKITPDGVVTTIGGSPGVLGHVDGSGDVARFNIPLGLAVDAAGNVCVGEEGNHAIRKGLPAGGGDPIGGSGGSAWLSKEPMPDARFAAQACTVDGRIYVLGGAGSATGDPPLLVYDPQLNFWQQRTGQPTVGTGGFRSVCAIDGTIYLIGGVPSVEAYDPKTDTWSTRSSLSMPAPRDGARNLGDAITVDGIIYLLRSGEGHVPVTLDAYDPTSDSWTVRASPPTGRNPRHACSMDGLIYAFEMTGAVLAYDPATDSWETKATLIPSAYSAQWVGSLGGLVYLFNPVGVVTYDPVQNAFGAATALPETREVFACTLAGARFYVMGGIKVDQGWPTDTIARNDVFVPDARTPVLAQQQLTQTVTAGGALALTVAADAGRSPCTYQWQRDGVAIPGATSATFTLPCAQSFHVADYTIVVTNEFGSTTSDVATVTVSAPPTSDSRLLNVSTRALCRTGAQILIPGFVIDGTTNKRLLLRAVGPTLGLHPFDLEGVLPNPRLALKRWNGAGYDDISANNNWRDNANAAAIATATAQVSAFPLIADRDAALLVDLAPGQYTVFADCADGGSGVAIVELYDADPSTSSGQATNDARLVNLSNRGFAGVGDEVMIPGFVVSAEGPKTLLVRVVGPTLAGAPHGVANTMADPKLALYRHEDNGANTLLFTQDNWGDPTTDGNAAHTATVAAQVQAFPLASASKDAAFVVTLPPGVYTVVGSSADGASSGIVLVELYVVP